MIRRYKSDLGPPDAFELAETARITAEVKKCVQALLADPATLAIFARVGIEGDFTADEQVLLFSAKCFEEAWGKIPAEWPQEGDESRRFGYRTVALALARRIAAGKFRSLDDPAVAEYVAKRIRIGGKNSKGIPYEARIDEQLVSQDDFFSMVRELHASKELADHIVRVRNFKPDPDSLTHQDRQLAQLREEDLRPMHSRIKFKYAYFSWRINLMPFAEYLGLKGIDPDDVASARQVLEVGCERSFIEGFDA